MMLIRPIRFSKTDSDCRSEVAINVGQLGQYPTLPATCQLVFLLASQRWV